MPLQGEHDACGQVWNPDGDEVVPGAEMIVLGPGVCEVPVLLGHLLTAGLEVQCKGLERSVSSAYI